MYASLMIELFALVPVIFVIFGVSASKSRGHEKYTFKMVDFSEKFRIALSSYAATGRRYCPAWPDFG